MVKNKIVKNRKHLHAYFEILYRASIDGDFEDTIYSLREGINPQLILFYTDDGPDLLYILRKKIILVFLIMLVIEKFLVQVF